MTGYKIQVSMDGQGHSWQTVEDGTHIDQVRDIECEIIDGGQESGKMIGTNGLLYRWMTPEVAERKQAAAALGRISTPKKAAASRENGRKGGRPRNSE